MIRICFLYLLILVLTLPASSQDQAEKEWLEDLDFLEAHYPGKHLDFQKLMEPDQFHRDLEKLRERIPILEDHEIILEIQTILARLGVSHSGILFYLGPLFKRVPVQLELFDDWEPSSSASPLEGAPFPMVKYNP